MAPARDSCTPQAGQPWREQRRAVALGTDLVDHFEVKGAPRLRRPFQTLNPTLGNLHRETQ